MCLVCTECQKALLAHQVWEYLSKHHQTAAIRYDKEKFDEACQKLKVSKTFPAIENMPVPAFDGICIEQGYKCSICAFCSPSKGTMGNHYRLQHKHSCTPGMVDQKEVLLQTFGCSVKTKQYFQVIRNQNTEAEHTGWESDVLKQAQDWQRKPSKSNEVPNARQVSPWLLSTKWHIAFEGHDKRLLRDLVKHPASTELPMLSDCVQAYYIKASSLIDDTNELSLQKINTPYPQ